MRVQCFTVGRFQVNTYLLTDEATGASALVDTGETDELIRRVDALPEAPDVRMILLTHGHIDHAGALPLLQERWDHIFYTGNGHVGRVVLRAAAEHQP